MFLLSSSITEEAIGDWRFLHINECCQNWKTAMRHLPLIHSLTMGEKAGHPEDIRQSSHLCFLWTFLLTGSFGTYILGGAKDETWLWPKINYLKLNKDLFCCLFKNNEMLHNQPNIYKYRLQRVANQTATGIPGWELLPTATLCFATSKKVTLLSLDDYKLVHILADP